MAKRNLSSKLARKDRPILLAGFFLLAVLSALVVTPCLHAFTMAGGGPQAGCDDRFMVSGSCTNAASQLPLCKAIGACDNNTIEQCIKTFYKLTMCGIDYAE